MNKRRQNYKKASLDDRREMINFNLYEAATAIRGFIHYQYPNWGEIDNDEIIGKKESLPMAPK